MSTFRRVESDRRVKPVDSGRHPRIRRREEDEFATELARRRLEATEDAPAQEPGNAGEEETDSGLLEPDRIEIASISQEQPVRKADDDEDEAGGAHHVDLRA